TAFAYRRFKMRDRKQILELDQRINMALKQWRYAVTQGFGIDAKVITPAHCPACGGSDSGSAPYGDYRLNHSYCARCFPELLKWCGSEGIRNQFPFFVLIGPTGVGKTHLLMATFRKLVRQCEDACIVNERYFGEMWQSACARNNYPNDLIERVREAPILVWDD